MDVVGSLISHERRDPPSHSAPTRPGFASDDMKRESHQNRR